MDILSHGLWGGIAFGRKSTRTFWAAFAFGVLPDLLAFGPHFAESLWDSLSDYAVNGISWAQPIILIPDIVLLVALYAWYFWIRKRKNKTDTAV